MAHLKKKKMDFVAAADDDFFLLSDHNWFIVHITQIKIF